MKLSPRAWLASYEPGVWSYSVLLNVAVLGLGFVWIVVFLPGLRPSPLLAISLLLAILMLIPAGFGVLLHRWSWVGAAAVSVNVLPLLLFLWLVVKTHLNPQIDTSLGFGFLGFVTVPLTMVITVGAAIGTLIGRARQDAARYESSLGPDDDGTSPPGVPPQSRRTRDYITLR